MLGTGSLKRILTRRIAVVGVLVVVAGTGVTVPLLLTASAKPSPSPSASAHGHGHFNGFGGPGLGASFGASADLVGLTAKALNETDQQVLTSLRAGKTYNQLLGLKAAGVAAAALSAEQTRLAAAVKAGHMTSAQETAAVAAAAKQIATEMSTVMKNTGPDFGGGHFGGGRFAGPAGAAFGLQGAVYTATEKTLGLTAQALETDVRGGKTLASVAGSKEAAVEAAALADYKTQLASQVTAKHLTAAQETQLLSKAPAQIKTILTATNSGFGGGGGGPAFGGAAIGFGLASYDPVITSTLGISQSTLIADLAAGKSLDTIAGSKATALKAALLAQLKTELAAQVKAGHLTAAEETKALTGAATEITQLMSRSGVLGGPHGGGQGHGGAPSSSSTTTA